jgi:hypothetical protein
MSVFFLVLAGAAALFGHAMYRTAKERVYRVGLSRIIVRFLLGKPWHGQALTDAGWRRPGTKALTRTGHASRFQHRPYRERILIRSGSALVLAAVAYGLVLHRAGTFLVLGVTVPLAAAGGGWLALRRARLRRHRRTWVHPLHHALAPVVGTALPGNPEKWLKVALDRSRVEVALPVAFDGNPNRCKAIEAAVTARVGMRSARADWSGLAGPKPVLVMKVIPPPPKKVTLVDVRDDIKAAAHDVLILGIGESGEVVSVSLAGDSPHLLLSIGSGGGKSVTAELVAAQAAYKGAIVLVLDYPKMVSLPSLRHLPNVSYCDSAALVHSACVWLARELEDRAALVKEHTDHDGVYRGPYIPRLLVVCEESNALMNRLRKYWADIRQPGDPKLSPAIDGLELASLMGRQLFINLLVIAQFGAVSATGSGKDGAARESMGVRILGRATQNNWKALVPEHNYPGKTVKPGRVHVVTDDCRETQLVKITHREARMLASAGLVTECPAGMPGRMRLNAPARPSLPGPEQGSPNETPPVVSIPGPDGVSLSEALNFGMVEAPSIHALRKRAQREHWEPVGRRGLAYLYDPAFLAGVGKEPR